MNVVVIFFFFSSRRRHTRYALVTAVQTCAHPICVLALMKSLSASGYIQLDPDTRCYVPTLRVAMLGTWIMGNLFMDGAVIALMDQVQKDTGETVILGDRKSTRLNSSH